MPYPVRLQVTKLTIPRLRPALVRRPHLVARLNAGLIAGRPLTLISAPAGYGKTTLAAEWVSQRDCRAAWLALDEADDDPLLFFSYLLAALQRLDPAIGAELMPALQAGQLPPAPVLVSTLANDLAAATGTVASGEPRLLCVLDDFQVIQAPAILAVLQALLAHGGAALHLVLVTREDPALPLARLRAADQMTEMRAAELRFAEPEIAALLREGMGLALTGRDLARLAERTEGWVAGLQLAGLSMQGRADASAFVESLSGSHRFILNYLTEEVLEHQPAGVQTFLLRTSILPQLTSDLCDAVMGITESADERSGDASHPPFAGRSFTDSQAILEHLDRANIFLLPLDDEGRWYRYHHLFAELLQAQLRRRDPERVVQLHRRASRWYEAQAMIAEAIDQSVAAAEYDRVVGLLEKHGWALLNEGHARQLEGWLNALPPPWREHSPRISLDFGWMHLLRGNLAQAAQHLARAEAAAIRQGDAPGILPTPETVGVWHAECLALRANLLQAQGRGAEAIEAANQALARTPALEQRIVALASLALGGAYRQAADFDRSLAAFQAAIRASRTSGDLVTEVLSVAQLTLMAIPYGRLRIAAGEATETIERLAHTTAAPLLTGGTVGHPVIGAVHGALGLICYEWNQLAQARAHLERGIHLGMISGHVASVIYSQANLAGLLQAEGAFDAAAAVLDEAARLLSQGAPGWVPPHLIARQARLTLAQGDPAAAEVHLRGSGVAPEDPVTAQTDPLHLAWIRLLAARRDARAADLAGRVIASAEAGGRNGTLLQALILAALLEPHDPDAARGHLTRALALAEPEGALRPFLDEGEPARLQIAACQSQIEKRPVGATGEDPARLKAFVAKVLAAFGARPPTSTARPATATAQPLTAAARPLTAGAQSSALIEPLSERELEVLRLLAAGLKYAEIADRLIVSLNTVRFHVKEIYGKLGVNRQAQAIARAQELQLL